MAARSFPSRVQHIQMGEPVSAGVTGRPDRTMEARTNYLKEVLDSIEAGRALLLRDQKVRADVLPGQPVFWNTSTQQYEPAQAVVYHDTDTGAFVTAPSADATGMVLDKHVGNTADIVLWGMVQFDSLANAIDGDVTPGRYYLSASQAGKLVLQRPPVTVPVCLVLGPLDACDEHTWVFVQPYQREFLENHIHLQFDLVPRPAGDHVPPAPGGIHVITNADSERQGWLPADDPSFGGMAPTGAKFGYNIAAHAGLSRTWPPVPASAVVLEMHKEGMGHDPSHIDTLQRVGGNFVRFDIHGIWWMTDCYDNVPWPSDLDTTVSSSLSSSSLSSDSLSSGPSGSSESATCQDVPRRMQLVLSFIKMTFLTDKTVVTSLQPDTDQPLRFVNCDGEEANTGDLFAQLVLDLLVQDEFEGGQVIKGVTDNNRFKRGWATEGLIAGSSKVLLTGTRSRLLDITAPAGGTNPRVHQGLVTVDVNIDPTERELLPQIVVLGDALERVYKGITYLGFPDGRNSGIRAKFVVPADGLPLNPTLKIRVQLLGRGTGTLTDLDTTYYILARPTTGVPTPLTAGDSALSMNTAVAVVPDEVHEVESEAISITPGDTIFVSLERSQSGSPTYDYEIGLVRLGAIIVPGA